MRLGALCTKIGSGSTPRGGSGVYTDTGTAFIRSQNVHNDRFERDNLAYIDDRAARALVGVAVEPGDVLLNITGESVGRCCLAPQGLGPARVSQHVMIVRPDSTLLSCSFLRYWLVSPPTQALLSGLSAAGATRRALTKHMVESLVTAFPSLDEQRRIAGVLGALDDKIALNRRMSETLEQIARVFYESWVSGAESGVAREHMRTVGDLVEFDPPTPVRRGEEHPYLGLAELPTAGPVHEPPTLRAFTSGARFRNLDTLLARITPSLENGKACIANGIPGDGLAWGSTELIVMRPRTGVPFSLPYLIARDEGFRALAIQNMTGTSGRQRVPREAVQRAPLPTPDAEVLTRFGEVVDPMFEAIFQRARESETLADIRDTLLPKLISGDLRIPHGERLVSEVT